MTYKLTIDQQPAYLHAIVTGRNSKGNVAVFSSVADAEKWLLDSSGQRDA